LAGRLIVDVEAYAHTAIDVGRIRFGPEAHCESGAARTDLVWLVELVVEIYGLAWYTREKFTVIGTVCQSFTPLLGYVMDDGISVYLQASGKGGEYDSTKGMAGFRNVNHKSKRGNRKATYMPLKPLCASEPIVRTMPRL
jgi:hypothetical protein